jgi:hypothetical protein
MLKWESVSGSIIELAIEGPIIPVLNKIIFNEYREVLSRIKHFPKTNFIVTPREMLDIILKYIDKISR